MTMASPSAPTATESNDKNDASQWTRVIRKGKALGRHGQVQVLRLPLGGLESNFPPNPNARLTVDDIRSDHAKMPNKWRVSSASKTLDKLIADNLESHAPITSAVCLGLGSFDPEDGSFDATRRSHVQLKVFLAIVKVLQAKTNHPVKCIFQEPRFTTTDKQFLEELGHTVVDSPGGFNSVGPDTMVFGIHLYRDIWASALDKALPAMFVGTGWDVWDECPGSDKSADFERIREMDRTYDKLAFPQDDQHTFSSTSIYWKKRDSGDVQQLDNTTTSHEEHTPHPG